MQYMSIMPKVEHSGKGVIESHQESKKRKRTSTSRSADAVGAAIAAGKHVLPDEVLLDARHCYENLEMKRRDILMKYKHLGMTQDDLVRILDYATRSHLVPGFYQVGQ